MIGDEDLDPVTRAFNYPYDRPEGSFLFDCGTNRARRLPLEQLSVLTRGLNPVLAIGSNAAPSQLARKFSGSRAVIPVASARLLDVDVVYAARVSLYGAIPATLVDHARAVVDIHITYLTAEQFALMDRTEGVGSAYEVVTVPARCVDVAIDGGGEPYMAYRATSGALLFDGSPWALSALGPGSGRFPLHSERDALTWVGSKVGVDATALIERATTDRAFLRELNRSLERLGTVAQDSRHDRDAR